MSREDVRVGIAKYFGGTTKDARNFYRPSPLKALGLSGVRAYYNDRLDDNRDYVEGLDPGAMFGAVMGVHLATTNETRLTIGGTLDRPYSVELYVWYMASKPPPEDAQSAFDDLLDAVVARIRADPTLGMDVNSGAPTIVTQAGEGARGITTTSAVPYSEPGAATYGSAVISFDVSTYPNIA
jgi:hypothetical protein